MTEDELMGLYVATPSRPERELAIAERELWADFVRETKRSGSQLPSRREWFRDKFGVTCIETDRRSRILKRGSLADPVWDLLDAGRVSMDSACNVLVEAESSPDPVAHVLAFCKGRLRPEEGFHEVKTASGKVMVRKLPKKASFSDPAPDDEVDTSTAKRVTAAIMVLAERFLESRLDGLEDYGIRRTISDEFKFAVRVACDDLVKGTAKIRSQGHPAARRVSIRESFEVLGVRPPRKKVSDDDRSRAKLAYRKLAGRYHPDRNPGDEGAAVQYKAVNRAWDAIQSHED